LLRLLAIPVLVLFFGVVVHAAEVTIGLDEWPPFSGENLPGGGITAEILTKVFEDAGYQPKILILPWTRIEKWAQSGKLDVMGNLYYIDEIAVWARYSDPYYQSKIGFVGLRGRSISWSALVDLKGFNIGVGRGYSFGSEFDHAGYLHKTVIPVTANGMRMMLEGRLDLVIDSEEVIRYHLAHDFSAEAKEFQILAPPLFERPISIGVAKNNSRGPQIIEDFNRSLARLRENGTIERIISHHVADLGGSFSLSYQE